MDDSNSPFTSIKDALKDSKRIKYHNDYLTNLAASIKYYPIPILPLPFLNLCYTTSFEVEVKRSA